MSALAGRAVWVIGASSGIGAAVAAELVGRGARVAVSARRADQLDVVDLWEALRVDRLPDLPGVIDQRVDLFEVQRQKADDPTLKKKVVGVETIDHPSDGQLVAHARKYFSAADRMRS